MTQRTRVRTALTLVLACALAGCGEKESAVVHGTLTLDGVPLASAAVELAPKTDTTNLTSHFVTTDEDGAFTFEAKSSSATPVLPGTYLILVKKVGPKPGAASAMDTTDILPPVYNDRTKTPLVPVEIHAGTNNLPALELHQAKRR